MNHGNGYRRLNRTHEHRKAMFSNMAGSLIVHEQIKTTLPKAKEMQRIIDKLKRNAEVAAIGFERFLLIAGAIGNHGAHAGGGREQCGCLGAHNLQI